VDEDNVQLFLLSDYQWFDSTGKSPESAPWS